MTLGQIRNHLLDAPARGGVGPHRCHLAEWKQDESTILKVRMGQLQLCRIILRTGTTNQPIEGQEIEVDHPCDVRRPANSAHSGFDGMEPPQQRLRRAVRFNAGDAVDVIGLFRARPW